ncbi:hypothetical protein SteCoe_37716 [Stentor coeruleus]|uniref:Uncharacterized protein n=1 Tax=Stentor coeruleus TaxID=5963 RepID=A0A1R2AMI5_9CILI|nr:hypothetical protein SteCoe_37716 [Stentor coeruleus]
MVDPYLKNKLKTLNAPESFKSAISFSLHNTLSEVGFSYFSKSFQIKPQDINVLIQKFMTKLTKSDVEERIRLAKLLEAKRMKKELQGNLAKVTEKMENLARKTQSPTVKIKLLDRQIRQEYFDNERKMTEEVAKKAQKFIKKQNEVLEAIERQKEKIIKHLERQKKIEQEKEKNKVVIRDERIREEREKMMGKKSKREKEKEMRKNMSENCIRASKKPLFLKYQEKFVADVEMPELERRKEELRKKREMFSPIPLKNIKDHSSWYNSIKAINKDKYEKEQTRKKLKEKKKIKDFPTTETTWTVRTLEEQRKEKALQIEKLQERVYLIAKKNKYADIVKQIYSPSVVVGLNHSKTPMKSYKKKSNRKNKSEDSSGLDSQWKPHKFKPNSMMPNSKTLKEPVVVNYLEERRKVREDNKEVEETAEDLVAKVLKSQQYLSSSTRDLEKAKKDAMKLEQLAKKKSDLFETSPVYIQAGNKSNALKSIKTSPFLNTEIKEAMNADTLLLGSIKSKLLILSKME